MMDELRWGLGQQGGQDRQEKEALGHISEAEKGIGVT